jgi:putative SOS response-associated peptidase YedK
MCRRIAYKTRRPGEEVYPGIRIKEDYEAVPGEKAYGLAYSVKGELKPFLFSFGYLSYDGKYLYNARKETVLEKKTFSEDYLRHKAVFPCTSFWEIDRKKEEHELISKTGEILYIAGFYDRNREFVLLTEEGQGEIRPLPPRMPVLLIEEDVVRYLKGEVLTDREHPAIEEKNPETVSLF